MKYQKSFPKTFAFWFAAISALAFFGAQPAQASKEIWSDGDASFKLGVDMRFRYEMDDQVRGGKDDRDRDRQRIRLRLKGKFKANDNLLAGFRIVTGSESLRSPHQTLGHANNSGNNADWGVDRAYIKVGGGGAALLLGKFGLPIWNPGEILWDSDIQPEGIALGWSSSVGDSGKISVGVAQLMVGEAHWGEDDTALAAQAAFSVGNTWQLKVAAGMLSFTDGDPDSEDNTLPGGDQAITHIIAEVKGAGISLKPKIGVAYSMSDGEASDFGGEDDDLNGLVVYAGIKVSGIKLSFQYWDAGYDSQPLQGMLAQDNFPYSSNFTGYKIQVGYKFFGGLKADLRYYFQEVKNGDITVWDNNIAQEGSEGVNERTRIQLNLNVRF